MSGPEKYDELIAYLTDAVKAGGDLVKEQAPLVAQEIIAWGIWYHTIEAAILTLAMVWAWRYLPKRLNRLANHHDFDIGGVFGWIGFVVASLIASVAVLIDVHNALQAVIAPRLYLLDYLKSLMR